MHQTTTEPYPFPSAHTPGSTPGSCPGQRADDDPLTACLREGARRMLIQAVEFEAAQWVDERSHFIDADARSSATATRMNAPSSPAWAR